MNPRTPIEQLLRVAASLAPPFVLLEDGLGTGTSVLAWGARERLRLGWDAAALGSLERFTPGDGWIGALGYDLGLPPKAMRRDAVLAQPVVDLFRPVNRITLRPQIAAECAGPDAAAAWEAALGHGALGPPVSGAAPAPAGVPRRSFTQAGFEDAVRRALEHIRAGDIYQVNLSVAERVALREPPFAVYRRLRAINPSPWMGYADFGDWQLVCGSPERLVEVADGAAHAKPIAGTRKKTGDPAADAAMRRELVTDAKEAAEHVMLVDLARNDLGRIARYGTVRVAELGSVEEYSHVMHLVSDVRGTLAPGIGPWEVFRAMFPGGTITGCPKIRSMEIIADLEPVARGMYTGALGWWDGGEGQWNILIRSAVVRDGEAVLQAGAGVVADSDPAREWKESLRKAAALRAAFVVADT
jgi:anthranilate/para-aminobenzoate synthase component I